MKLKETMNLQSTGNEFQNLECWWKRGEHVIIIDYKDSRPIYEQVTAKFKDLILKGGREPDSQTASVWSLAMELAINPNTIEKAYAQL